MSMSILEGITFFVFRGQIYKILSLLPNFLDGELMTKSFILTLLSSISFFIDVRVKLSDN